MFANFQKISIWMVGRKRAFVENEIPFGFFLFTFIYAKMAKTCAKFVPKSWAKLYSQKLIIYKAPNFHFFVISCHFHFIKYQKICSSLILQLLRENNKKCFQKVKIDSSIFSIE
jgi:hypothetical protein